MVCSNEEIKSSPIPMVTTDAASGASSATSSGNETDEDDVVTKTVIRRRVPARTKRLSSIAKMKGNRIYKELSNRNLRNIQLN